MFVPNASCYFSPFGRGAIKLLKHDIINLTRKVWQIKTYEKYGYIHQGPIKVVPHLRSVMHICFSHTHLPIGTME
jgi:hypothetical protein